MSEISRYVDWEITALFYSAVHVDEYLFLIGEEPCNHQMRNKMVRENIQHAYQDYYKLFMLCRRVRYEISYADVSGERETAIYLHDSMRRKLQMI